MSGLDQLDAIIAKVRALGGAPEEVAKLAAKHVGAAIKKTAAAGTSPDGVAWAPKKDGSRALTGAAAAVECTSTGTVVKLRLVGTLVSKGKHGPGGDQKAQAIQNNTRPILPERGAALPQVVVDAVDAAAKEYFATWKKP